VPPIGDTSLTHVKRLAALSTTSPTPTEMGQSFIMTLYKFTESLLEPHGVRCWDTILTDATRFAKNETIISSKLKESV
jgi:hypothetical protein